MAEIIDDTYTLTISALQTEVARIADVIVNGTPVVNGGSIAIEVDTPFNIEYKVYNDGGVTGNMFGRLIDATDPENEIIIAGSDWTEDIVAGGFKTATHSFASGISQDISLEIEAGHNALD